MQINIKKNVQNCLYINICIVYTGLHSYDLHKGEHLLVSLPQVLEAGPVPGDGSAGGDPGDGRHRLP